jgi:hypothetical protein
MPASLHPGAASYEIFSVWQSYTISRAFSASGGIPAACSRQPIPASKEAIADSLGQGDQQELRDCWGIGSEDAMAQVIEFYVPDRFRKKVRWVPPEQRGKVITFPVEIKKSA